MKKTPFLSGLFMLFAITAFGQSGKTNDLADERPERYALTNATVHLNETTTQEGATVLIEGSTIIQVMASGEAPQGYRVLDLEGKHVYPGLIDLYSKYGTPQAERSRDRSRGPQFVSKVKGPFGWNQAIRSEFEADKVFEPSEKDAAALRKLGFTAVLTHRHDGIHRGSGSLVSTAKTDAGTAVIVPAASTHFSFQKGTSTQSYPSSIMGSVALLRQTHYDASYYAAVDQPESYDATLEAFNAQRALPAVFEVRNRLRALLADEIGEEMGYDFIVRGNGDEYQRTQELADAGLRFILPLDFPDAYDVEDPYGAVDIDLEEMWHWEHAAENAARLHEVGIEFTFTLDGLDNQRDFWKNLRGAIEKGLPEEVALAAMTTTPARWLGVSDRVGQVDAGYRADLLITDTTLFAKGCTIYQVWTGGQVHEYKALRADDYAGVYDLSIEDSTWTFKVLGDAGKHRAEIALTDSTTLEVTSKFKGPNLVMSFQPEGLPASIRLNGFRTDNGYRGSGQWSDGRWVDWTATCTSALPVDTTKKKKKKEDSSSEELMAELPRPFNGYGYFDAPEDTNIVFRKATIWTLAGDQEVLEEADLWVRNGRIEAVGVDLEASGATEVDASGMHLTPGIVDEHSHIALSGVNEGTMNSSAEVRMYDAVDSDDIDIYRQLAGGVVAAQLLHGSANPIGGQSALVKFRWGASPQEMRIERADGFIKFALGENVKQSNWGDDNRVRFPQTRMGVEQVYVNAFTRAMDYRAVEAQSGKKEAFRRDLELEALAEIVESQRFITCHSYVQSEINMLMKVAEQFGFRINTFTHILEGYKVADIMAEHGAGGSTFADWWAYKYEVKEAIPYNAALMHEAGVTVAINSDDAEMGRRLNQEAAKAVKYGGVSEVEALKMVTLNPAKLLHLDEDMGTLEPGKSADLVLWTGHPLSVYSEAQTTLIDGRVYFDRAADAERLAWIQSERQRLIALMRGEKEKGAKTQKPKEKQRHHWHCDDLLNQGVAY